MRTRTCIFVVVLAFASLVDVAFARVDVAEIDRERVLSGASNALITPPITITSFPAKDSEGGTNDYYSNGDYWWPNPHTPTGLPYVRRDGEANPNNFNKHRECLREMSATVAVLGAAYKLTGEDRYAEKAAELLRVFFLDPATRMTPNLDHAQAVPGVSPGRSAGIIDTLHLIEIPEAIEVLNRSPAFPSGVSNGMKIWFGDYVHWMLTSKNGREEASAGNNHAVAFWLQVAVFSRFTGNEAALVDCRRQYKDVFVPKQMAADGSFPAELKRTKPYGYSIFQLDNMTTLCQVLSTPQDDLWKFELRDGRGIRKAVAYLYPALLDKSKWQLKPDVEAWDGWPVRQPSLLFAGIAFNDQTYIDLWKRLPAEPVSAEVRRNMAITQPLLWIKDGDQKTSMMEIRTPPASHSPRINGASVFGVRPGHPFLYHIPATGDRPMNFSAKHLPDGLRLDAAQGEITGLLQRKGTYTITLRARNALGKDDKEFKVFVGDRIALTPPMGWNSWNHFGTHVSQQIVLDKARAMAQSGLIDHGWSYVDIDDGWQGLRGEPYNAIQGNEKFPDIKSMCREIHALGLKVGIYSTPWATSYAGHIGGSSENPEGTWTKPSGPKMVNKKILPWAIGRFHFTTNDVRQWAEWGIDLLKYDWNPIEPPETGEMADALRQSGRDIVFCLSNNLNVTNAPEVCPLANSWRTTGDIKANWKSMSSHGFGQDKWRQFCKPGHWNDPDMLEISTHEKNQPGLTPDEEYTHMSIWCLDSAPLLLGNDLTAMDAFTLNLLENDEVLAVDQDPLGDQAICVAATDDTRVYAKELVDASYAVGLFNLGTNGPGKVTIDFHQLKTRRACHVRDLWRQRDLGRFQEKFSMLVNPHGAELIRISK